MNPTKSHRCIPLVAAIGLVMASHAVRAGDTTAAAESAVTAPGVAPPIVAAPIVAAPGIAAPVAAAPAVAAPAMATPPAAPAVKTKPVELRLLEFRPKLSPDTLARLPAVARRTVAALPPAQLSLLGDLVATLEALKERAATKPGDWRLGPVYLGANAQEYRPSDDELLAAELGDRVRRIVGTADPATSRPR